MTTAVVEAQEEFVARKGLRMLRCSQYHPGTAVVGGLLRTEDRSARLAGAPSPDLIGPPLGPGIDNVGFLTALYANHDHILSYGSLKSQWISFAKEWISIIYP